MSAYDWRLALWAAVIGVPWWLWTLVVARAILRSVVRNR